MLETAFYDYLVPALENAVADRDLPPELVKSLVGGLTDLPEGRREAQMLDAFGELAKAANMPDLGFVAAQAIPITAFGVVSLVIPVAPTLGDMLSVLRRFQRLIARPLLIDLTVEEGEAVIVMTMQGMSGPGLDQLACGSLLVIDRHIETYTGKPHNFTKVEMTTPMKEVGLTTRKHLGIDPTLESQRIAAHFPAAYLEMSSPTADPVTFQGVLKLCEQAEQAMGRVPDIPTRVREIITAHVADPPELSQLASRLGVSERQLRFALTRAETSYQAIVREARVAQASAMLRNADLPISTVAYRIGYADPANFSSAFKKWTGQSPREMRARLRETQNET